jgi:hypothetical protein
MADRGGGGKGYGTDTWFESIYIYIYIYTTINIILHVYHFCSHKVGKGRKPTNINLQMAST